MVLEVVIDGVPYAEEAYVKDPMQYLATEYGAKYIKATRKPVKDICRFAQKHAEELDSISFVCRYEDKERLYTSLDKEIPNIYVTSSVPNLMEVGHIAVSYTHLDVYKRQGVCTRFSRVNLRICFSI